MNDEKNEASTSVDLPKKNNSPHINNKNTTPKTGKPPQKKLAEKKAAPINADVSKPEKPRPAIKMNRKPAFNNKNTYAPKQSVRSEKPKNKIDVLAAKASINTKETKVNAIEPKENLANTKVNVTETSNPATAQMKKDSTSNAKLKTYTPNKTYKARTSEENKPKLVLNPKANQKTKPKIVQNTVNNPVNKDVVNTNAGNIQAIKPILKLKSDRIKSDNFSKDASFQANDSNLNSLEKAHDAPRLNIPHKKYKSNQNIRPRLEKPNDQEPIAINQAQRPVHQKQTQRPIGKRQPQIPVLKEQVKISTPPTQAKISARPTQAKIATRPAQAKIATPPAQAKIATRPAQAKISAQTEQTQIPAQTEQTQISAQTEQAHVHRAQAKPRRPRNRGKDNNTNHREILDVSNDTMEKVTNNETLGHTTAHTSLENNNIKQNKHIPAKNIAVSNAKILPKTTKQKLCKMLISVVPGEQVEVIILDNNIINEYYLEMFNQKKTKGNIYKGVIHNIDANLQAAFINYGTNKNGFLQIDEVHPEYYTSPHNPSRGKKFPPMQKVLKTKQEVLVQVVKEPSGNKGAFLTTWLSLAGRFLVLTPGQEQIGVSRKVVDEEERARLRAMVNGIEPGEGLGVIVRTSSEGTSKTTLKNDLQYLKRLWKDIRKKGTSETAPALVYQELSLAERAMRDYLSDDIYEVWIDDASVADSLRETASLLFPRKKDLIKVHTDIRQSLWERFNIQQQLEQIYSREVILPSGGRLIFDQTEALMAIDINSGKISGKNNFETMAHKTNMEAAEGIARQLKLRDIGGQIVIDFIEMRDKNHIREVEKTLNNAMRTDRARHDVGRISSFGLLEMVRQRTASSAIAVSTEPCPICEGTGIRRNIEWQALQALRHISRNIGNGKKSVYDAELSTELTLYFLNHKRESLHALEKQYGVKIEIKVKG